MHWCSSLSDSRVGGPETGVLPCPPIPLAWPRLPGLLLGGGKKKHLCSPVLLVLLSWTVNTMEVSNFLLQCLKASLPTDLSRNCIFHFLLWHMSPLSCGSGLANRSDRSPNRDICNYSGTLQVSVLARRTHWSGIQVCVRLWTLFPKTFMYIPLFFILIAYTFKHTNMKAKEKPTWTSLWQPGHSSVKQIRERSVE